MHLLKAEYKCKHNVYSRWMNVGALNDMQNLCRLTSCLDVCVLAGHSC